MGFCDIMESDWKMSTHAEYQYGVYVPCPMWELAYTMESLDPEVINRILRHAGMCAACTYSENGVDCTLDDEGPD